MSSSAFSKEYSTPGQTRRAPIKTEDNQSSRRSLSGRFRNLFQKNPSSPTRSPPLSTRQRSPSPESTRTSTEAPHLRAPVIRWPFGKKKTKSNDKQRKTKKKTTTTTASSSSIEISGPVYYQEHQTSIRGQNFVPRTPSPARGGTGRTHSTSSFETTTKGFRDYTIIDGKKPPYQVMVSDLDTVSPPPYISDHSRSPSLHRRRLPDTNIDHAYHNEISVPISEIEMSSLRKQNSGANSSLINPTQILIEQNPILRPPISSKPTTGSTLSNPYKNISYASSNNSEIRSTLSSSKEVEIPKLHVPLISLGSTANKKDSKYTNEKYNSLATVNNNHQSYIRTYGSLPDGDALNNNMNNSLYRSTDTIESYPGLEAILKHHFLPTSVHYQPSRLPEPTSPKRTIRFDTSTTTLNDYDDRPQWTTVIHKESPSSSRSPSPSPSPPSIRRHDGYIRPLTPQRSLIQPDISTILVNLDDLRRQSPTRRSFYHSPETTPVTYRSSTTIYTKDRHNYPNGGSGGGELRTWSLQRNDNMTDRKGPISFQLIPETKKSGVVEEEYTVNHYSNNYPSTTSFLRSSFFNERDKISDQSTRSYKQESFNTITTPVEKSEVALRHYTLKRTDSYDGLGITISADRKTRLNHRIRDVEYGSPGARIGLQKNDRIIQINGINVENMIFDNVLKLVKQGLDKNNLQLSVL